MEFYDAPVEQNPIVGQDAEVKCLVRGDPEPAIVWKFNGETISTSMLLTEHFKTISILVGV